MTDSRRSFFIRVLVVSLASTSLVVAMLNLPADAAAKVPATPLFAKSIEALSPSQSESGKCRSTPLPGASAFAGIITTTYGKGQTIYFMRACNDGPASAHKQGRGIDWMASVNNSSQKANAQAFIGWLLATDKYGNKYAMARRLGVMYIIYDKKIWEAHAASKGWQPYHGASDHTDHVHVSLSWDGANKKTTYWTAQQKPQPKPTPPPPVLKDRNEVAITNWGASRIDVFHAGTSHAVYQKTFANGAWSKDWTNLGGSTTGGVAAVARANNLIDLFVRGTDNAVYQKSWNGSAWSDWTSIGGQISGTPFVTSSGSGNLDLVVRGLHNELYYRQFRNNAWGDWIGISGMTTASTPAAIMTTDNTMQLFVRSPKNTVATVTWSNGAIGAWSDLGGNATSGIGAINDNFTFHVFARGAGNAVFEKTIAIGGSESDWKNIGGVVGVGISAVQSGSNVVIATAGTNGTIYTRTLTGSAWSGWVGLGGVAQPLG